MLRKVLKYTLRVILIFIGLLLLISVLVYIPPVQDLVKDKLSTLVSNNLGMHLSIDRFRLRFPLKITLDNTTLITERGDTLLHSEEFSLGASILPLLRGEIAVSGVDLKNSSINYIDTLANLNLRATIDELYLRSANVRPRKRSVRVGRLDIADAGVELWVGENNKPDTTAADTTGWKIDTRELLLERVSFQMHMSPEVRELSASFEKGELENCSVDLFSQAVTARLLRLETGHYSYLTDPLTVKQDSTAIVDSLVYRETKPWTIRLGRFEAPGNEIRYGVIDGEPGDGFDASNIELTQLNIILDSIYNRNSEVAFTIRELDFIERSGLEITDTKGRIRLDSSEISVDNFRVQTPVSKISINARASGTVLQADKGAHLTAEIESDVDFSDIFIFYHPDPQVRRTLTGKNLLLDGSASGTLGDLDISQLDIRIPGHINLEAKGNVISLTESDFLAGNLRFQGTFTNVGFIKGFLSDSLRQRIDFPSRMTLSGSASASAGIYSTPSIILRADSGRLDLKGRVDVKRQIYDVSLNALNFPLYQFLPNDSLGLITLSLDAEGQGFDPQSGDARADIDLNIQRLDYNRYDYHDIALNVTLLDHILDGELSSSSEGMNLELNLSGEIRERSYLIDIEGKVNSLDFENLNLSQSPLAAAMTIDAELGIYPDTTYRADILLDSVRLLYGTSIQNVGLTTITALADKRNVAAQVRSGDLSLDFNSPVGLDSLLPRFSATATEIQNQIDARSLDMENIQEVLPSFNLELNAGRNNILRSFMEPKGYDFNKLSVSASTMNSRPFHAAVVVNGFRTGGITLDTLNVWMRRNDSQLNYAIRLRNRPGNIEQMALIRVMGNIKENTAQANFYQRNRSDSVGFQFGLNAELLDSAIRVNLVPENPVFGYEPWTVNPDNYLEYNFNKQLFADLRLQGTNQHVNIQSASMPAIPRGAVNIDIQGIDLGKTLSLFPAPPQLDGIVSSDLTIGLDNGLLAAEGEVGVDSMRYNRRAVGDVGLNISYSSDTTNRQIIDGTVLINGNSVLTAQGTYAGGTGDGTDFDINIPSLPLVAVNPFLPEDAVKLSGNLRGDFRVKGPTSSPNINGGLNFSDAQLTVPIAATTFGITPGTIDINNSVLDFNSFALIAPNNEELSLDGTVDLSDFSSPSADLELYATDFEFVNSSRSSGSQIYGRALIDVDVTAKGRIDALAVRGNVRLLNNTDVFYTLQQGPVKAESEKQDIVTFVSFADSAYLSTVDSLAPLRVWGMDMLVNVDIDDGVEATINLADDGSNRIELIGEGSLTYTMNSLGDSRFTGRYNLSGGNVVYNPPVITQKNFAINTDSYVEWTGEIANPTFNITATESVRTTVTMDESTSSNVNFDIIVNVRNTLQDLAIVFDLAAPNDLTIQNQLSSLAPEQRSQQALALLIYNTYTGPGTTAKVDVNNPLNSFIAKELNQWARNSLNNVDVSFGINNIDDASGGSHTDYTYRVSKSLFDDRVKVTVGGSLSSEDNTTDNLKENFVDDISLEYRLTERDNMFLKAYRYNTQESILEGEVTETGFGFVVRKKMDKLKELFRLIPPPEKRQQRREKREVKKQLRQEEREAGVDPAREQRQDNPLSPEDLDNELNQQSSQPMPDTDE